jgi:SET domain-containing protein
VVDDRGRIVAIANRDIAANEECSIAYFDLAEHIDLEDRQRLTRDLFIFSCNCERCLREAKDRGISLHQ